MNKELLNEIKITPLLDSLKLEKIEDSVYFSEKYNGYISNSRLSLINPEQDNNPEAFFEGLGKNKIYSNVLELGSAVHSMVLQSDLFELVQSVDAPTSKMYFMANFLYNKCNGENPEISDIIEASEEVKWYSGKLTDARIEEVYARCSDYWKQRKAFEKAYKGSKTLIFLDPKLRQTSLECVAALARNKQIQDLLHPEGFLEPVISENEQAILLDVEISMPNIEPFILRIKSKVDNYTIDRDTNTLVVNDVKTIGKIVSEFNSNFQRFHYHRELSLYSWLMTLVAKKYYGMDTCTVESNCLVVSTIPKYYTKVYKLSKTDFIRGWEEFKYLLRLVAYYYSNGYRFK